MSGRTLGRRVQYKKRHASVAPEAKGRQAFEEGRPITDAPFVTCPCCGGWGTAMHGDAAGTAHAWPRRR